MLGLIRKVFDRATTYLKITQIGQPWADIRQVGGTNLIKLPARLLHGPKCFFRSGTTSIVLPVPHYINDEDYSSIKKTFFLMCQGTVGARRVLGKIRFNC